MTTPSFRWSLPAQLPLEALQLTVRATVEVECEATDLPISRQHVRAAPPVLTWDCDEG